MTIFELIFGIMLLIAVLIIARMDYKRRKSIESGNYLNLIAGVFELLYERKYTQAHDAIKSAYKEIDNIEHTHYKHLRTIENSMWAFEGIPLGDFGRFTVVLNPINNIIHFKSKDHPWERSYAHNKELFSRYKEVAKEYNEFLKTCEIATETAA